MCVCVCVCVILWWKYLGVYFNAIILTINNNLFLIFIFQIESL